MDQILVEPRACIQPYFVASTVRTRMGGPGAPKLAAVLDGDHDNGAVTEALDRQV